MFWVLQDVMCVSTIVLNLDIGNNFFCCVIGYFISDKNIAVDALSLLKHFCTPFYIDLYVLFKSCTKQIAMIALSNQWKLHYTRGCSVMVKLKIYKITSRNKWIRSSNVKGTEPCQCCILCHHPQFSINYQRGNNWQSPFVFFNIVFWNSKNILLKCCKQLLPCFRNGIFWFL